VTGEWKRLHNEKLIVCIFSFFVSPTSVYVTRLGVEESSVFIEHYLGDQNKRNEIRRG
jgi:hypothetical protein